MKLQNPCAQCMRVRNPEQCDDVRCGRWQRYFLHRWDMIHRKGQQLLGQERA